MTKENAKIRVRNQRKRVKTIIKGESLTRQSEAKAADINNIVKKARKTGYLPVVDAQPIDTSVPSPQSYHDAMNLVASAQQQFEQLPSQVRTEFENNPAKLLEALQDPAQEAKLQDLGILAPPPPAEVLETPSEPVPEPVPETPTE